VDVLAFRVVFLERVFINLSVKIPSDKIGPYHSSRNSPSWAKKTLLCPIVQLCAEVNCAVKRAGDLVLCKHSDLLLDRFPWRRRSAISQANSHALTMFQKASNRPIFPVSCASWRECRREDAEGSRHDLLEKLVDHVVVGVLGAEAIRVDVAFAVGLNQGESEVVIDVRIYSRQSELNAIDASTEA
jgi:hypothetical protein